MIGAEGHHLPPSGACSASALLLNEKPYPHPPLRKHRESQENNGQTGSRCLDKPVLACNTRYQKNVCH